MESINTSILQNAGTETTTKYSHKRVTKHNQKTQSPNSYKAHKQTQAQNTVKNSTIKYKYKVQLPSTGTKKNALTGITPQLKDLTYKLEHQSLDHQNPGKAE